MNRALYTDEKNIIEFYKEIVVSWMVEPKTVRRMSCALQCFIDGENSRENRWILTKSQIWRECQTYITENGTNFSAYKRDARRTTDLDPGQSIKRTVTRNDFLKISTAWVEGFPEYDLGRLEVLFSCLWYYKTLVRYGTLMDLEFRCL